MITQPTASPSAIPPAAFQRKSKPAPSSEKLPAVTAMR